MSLRSELAQGTLDESLPSNLVLLKETSQVKHLHTIIRDAKTSRRIVIDYQGHDFIFYADRLSRLLIEKGMLL